MTNQDAIKWLENLKQDIGQLRHEDLWHYEQAIDEIADLLKEQPEIVRCKDCKHYRYYGLDKWTISECEINHVENQPEDWFCADGKRKD